MGLLACAHCNFDPAVLDYLTLRHKNVAKTVVPPTCPVTTGLLVALHLTAHGKKDLLDCVIQMDTHPWITVFDMTNEKEHARAVIRCRARLLSRITDTLKKAVGRGGKGRVKVTGKDSDPADTNKCLNRLLCEKYVPMPDKIRKRKRDSSSAATTGSSTASNRDATAVSPIIPRLHT
jgi:hypothetical protein